MKYLGRYMLGDRLGLSLQTRTAQAPALPDAAPLVVIVNSAGNAVSGYSLPPARSEEGTFARAVHLNRQYVVGRYAVRYTYKVAGQDRAEVDIFDIVDGGDPGGAVIAGYPFHRPHAEFHVLDLDSGELIRGRNPYV